MGAPAKLTPEREKVIIEALEAGNWVATAANLAGVTARTVRNWVKRGEEEPDAYPDEAAFAKRYRETLAEAENQLLLAVRNGATTDARHAEWLLEKRFSKRWKRTETKRLEMSGPGGGPITTKVTTGLEGFTDAQLIELSRRARLVLDAGGEGAGSARGPGVEGEAPVPAPDADGPADQVSGSDVP